MENTPIKIGEISAQAAQRNLAILIKLRWLAIGGQIAAIWLTHSILNVELPVIPMSVTILCLAGLNIISLWQLRAGKTISDVVVAIELLCDVAALTVLLYYSGGAANPFINLLIVNVILAIILLPWQKALVIVAATIASYYWLLGHGMPMVFDHANTAGHAHMSNAPAFFDLHRDGMFWSFVISSFLLAWFVLHITTNLRERDQQIESLRRQMLDEYHLVRLGLLSSGAAHELGTPLTTLAVTLDDWREFGIPDEPERDRAFGRLLAELTRCRGIVSDMLFSSGQERLEDVHPEIAGRFIGEIANNWRNTGVAVEIDVTDKSGRSTIMADPTLSQALRQVFDNAQEAGATRLTVALYSDALDRLMIEITDNGPGFSSSVLAAYEQGDTITPRDPGRGLGLLLVQMSMRRLSGYMDISNPPTGGAKVVFNMPLIRPDR